MIFRCASFLVTSVVRIVAAFIMLLSAQTVYARTKERIEFAGVGCLSLFVFAWLRAGAMKQCIGRLRSRDGDRVTLWQASDLLILVGGVGTQMFYVWHGSTNSDRGGPVEDAFTVFWLWVLYLLCALTVTPSGGAGAAPGAHGDSDASVREQKFYVTELIGLASGSPRLGRDGQLLPEPKKLAVGADSDFYSNACDKLNRWQQLFAEIIRAAPRGPITLPPLMDVYIEIHKAYIWGDVSKAQWDRFVRSFGASPAVFIERCLSDDLPMVNVRMIFALTTDPQDSVIDNVVRLFCLYHCVFECGESHAKISVRLLHEANARQADKRTLLGGRSHAKQLGEWYALLQKKQTLGNEELRNDDDCADRLLDVYELCYVEHAVGHETVYQIYTELATLYNKKYLLGRKS